MYYASLIKQKHNKNRKDYADCSIHGYSKLKIALKYI